MEAKYGLLVLTFYVAIFTGAKCDIYTSIQKITALAEMEDKLFKEFEVFLQKSDTKGEIVPDTVIRFYNERKTDGHLDKCLDMAHPVRAFYIQHRVYNEWGAMIEDLKANKTIALQPTVAGFLHKYKSVMTSLGFWPALGDVAGAADNILRLWNVYDLNVKDIINGEIASTMSRPLKKNEIEFITGTAKNLEMVYYHLSLLSELYNRTQDEAEKENYRKRLNKEYYLIKTRTSSTLLAPTLAYTDFQRFQAHNLVIKEATRSSISQDDINSFFAPPNTFMKLCRGPAKSKIVESKLRCFLRKTAIPIYMAKEEVVNYTPRISLFHDVISNDDIRQLKKAGTKKLTHSRTGGGYVTRLRVSQTGWVYDQAIPQVSRRLARRIANIVNLDTTFRSKASPVEPWQVLSYTTGGYYGEHIDPDIGDEFLWNMTEAVQGPRALWRKHTGQRIATWMFYLSDVEAGGATVFPKLEARVPVVKGAAAFWYNLTPSGKIDRRTQHAGCPVILGSKWVCNKWIHEVSQEFKRPCGKTVASEDVYEDEYMPPY